MLSTSPLFQKIDHKDQAWLEAQYRTEEFKKNTVIFEQGSPASHLYIVLEGCVKLYKQKKGTEKEEIVCVINPGNFFCLSPVLEEKNNHMSAKTIKNTQLMILSGKTVRELIKRSHTFSQNIIKFLSKKECELCEKVCDLSLSTTKQRLAKYLLKEYKDQEMPRSLKLQLNQTELASYLGTVRENLSRDLSDLKKAGIIESKMGRISIIEPDELIQITSK